MAVDASLYACSLMSAGSTFMAVAKTIFLHIRNLQNIIHPNPMSSVQAKNVAQAVWIAV